MTVTYVLAGFAIVFVLAACWLAYEVMRFSADLPDDDDDEGYW